MEYAVIPPFHYKVLSIWIKFILFVNFMKFKSILGTMPGKAIRGQFFGGQFCKAHLQEQFGGQFSRGAVRVLFVGDSPLVVQFGDSISWTVLPGVSLGTVLSGAAPPTLQ